MENFRVLYKHSFLPNNTTPNDLQKVKKLDFGDLYLRCTYRRIVDPGPSLPRFLFQRCSFVRLPFSFHHNKLHFFLNFSFYYLYFTAFITTVIILINISHFHSKMWQNNSLTLYDPNFWNKNKWLTVWVTCVTAEIK